VVPEPNKRLRARSISERPNVQLSCSRPAVAWQGPTHPLAKSLTATRAAAHPTAVTDLSGGSGLSAGGDPAEPCSYSDPCCWPD
jgi:hypothetical protein